jgi:hypothetical protein
MNRTPDDATRLMNLLIVICGDQIRDYRPRSKPWRTSLRRPGDRHEAPAPIVPEA